MWLNRRSSWDIEENKEGSLLYLGSEDVVSYLLMKSTQFTHVNIHMQMHERINE